MLKNMPRISKKEKELLLESDRIKNLRECGNADHLEETNMGISHQKCRSYI